MRRQVFALCFALVVTSALAPVAQASVADHPEAGDWLGNLQGVSADSSTDAWAVGWSASSNLRKTLIEHWDGHAWTIVPSPNRSPKTDDVLTGVTSISPGDAWAVGFYQSKTGGYRTLVLHWDGAAWSHIQSPSGHHYTILSAVSAVSADDIWAVGCITKHVGQWYRSLFEHWDGTSWTIVDSTLPRRRKGPVTAVSAVNSADVWAGGQSIGGNNATIFHRGDTWAPYTDVAGNVQDMSMDSPTDGWAVGGALYLHWDGSQWVNTPGSWGYLQTVLALSPTDAWAGGDELEHWDGHAWTRADSYGHGTVFDLDGVGPDDIWAIGDADPVGPPIIQHWDGKTWSLYPSGT